jgi:hypothetical protein
MMTLNVIVFHCFPYIRIFHHCHISFPIFFLFSFCAAALAAVRDGSPSSSDDDVPQRPNATRSASAAELEAAAAATDALFQQLSVFQGGPEGGSQVTHVLLNT